MMVCFATSKTYVASFNWDHVRPGGFRCNRIYQGSLGKGQVRELCLKSGKDGALPSCMKSVPWEEAATKTSVGGVWAKGCWASWNHIAPMFFDLGFFG